ncbi:hypothetical protein Rhe02_41680 [Rhizocola hellebori]|uniref:DinB-like domain-containing protein n=1 Tax=Rhizocola hellebori TaxID=1392758 RepID=A0A8J3VHJ0_9ACTN|nr:DinB family protein [Rhizocola hellebori]GIH06101.1 hypothetical protein Rhe02_41680 [Rhizocola hellebori]
MTDETGRGAIAATPHTPAGALSAWLRDLEAGFLARAQNLDAERLAFRPDPGGNSVGVTLWHFTRWLDVVAHRVWVDGEAGDELWHARGWARQTGYDPSGLGHAGLGVVTGYTLAEVNAIPNFDAVLLTDYFGSVADDLQDLLHSNNSETLHGIAPGLGGQWSRYTWISVVLQGSFGHLGEIDALLAMRQRNLEAGR